MGIQSRGNGAQHHIYCTTYAHVGCRQRPVCCRSVSPGGKLCCTLAAIANYYDATADEDQSFLTSYISPSRIVNILRVSYQQDHLTPTMQEVRARPLQHSASPHNTPQICGISPGRFFPDRNEDERGINDHRDLHLVAGMPCLLPEMKRSRTRMSRFI